MADDENEENKQPTLSGVKIDPPDLKFPVTLNKSSKQQLRVSVSSAAENGVTFKIKTTNPKRYSVRPNVGVAWPGADAARLCAAAARERAAARSDDLRGEAWTTAKRHAVHPLHAISPRIGAVRQRQHRLVR